MAGMKNEPFRIFAYLPDDRRLPGFLCVFDPAGAKRLYDIPCRGKADSSQAARQGNTSRDATRPYGDTPAGLYRPSRITRFAPSHKTLGPTAILLEGQTGDALKAAQRGRTGLAVHGNRGNDRLMATYGCLRLFDRDIALLAKLIGEAAVVVEVFSVTDWPKIKGQDS